LIIVESHASGRQTVNERSVYQLTIEVIISCPPVQSNVNSAIRNFYNDTDITQVIWIEELRMLIKKENNDKKKDLRRKN
jgi:hypothetical protein